MRFFVILTVSGGSYLNPVASNVSLKVRNCPSELTIGIRGVKSEIILGSRVYLKFVVPIFSVICMINFHMSSHGRFRLEIFGTFGTAQIFVLLSVVHRGLVDHFCPFRYKFLTTFGARELFFRRNVLVFRHSKYGYEWSATLIRALTATCSLKIVRYRHIVAY